MNSECFLVLGQYISTGQYCKKRIWEIDKGKLVYGIFKLSQLVTLHLWMALCTISCQCAKNEGGKKNNEGKLKLCSERYFRLYCANWLTLVQHKPCASRELLYMSSAYTIVMSHLTIFWASIDTSLGFYMNMGREDPHLLIHRTPFSISLLTHMATIV